MVRTVQFETSPAALDHLYQDYWDFVLRENPRYATYLGDHRYDAEVEDSSEEAFGRRLSQYREFLGRLQAYPKPGVGTDRLNYELFEREVNDSIEELSFRPYLMPITQQQGPHIGVPELVTYHPFRSVQDYENYLSRLRKFPRLIDQTITNMGIGVRERLVLPRIIVERIVPQLKAQIVQEPDGSEFYKPVTTLPKEILPEDARRLGEECADAILGSIVSAYEKLASFLQEEYLPASRSEVGIWALPDGGERYAFYVRHFTTTRLSSDEIHQLGLRELAKIRREMEAVMRKLGFTGTVQEFLERLRKNKAMYYPSGEALVAGFKDILRKMDTALPRLFGRLPKAQYGFREIEAYRAEAAPEAYYYPPPEDGSRPGYFYVNTFRPETRPKYTMESLAYHEAVPGHHLQISIQQELTGLPKFRRHGGYTAFVEGWAHYAEALPKEIGFYSDLYSEFGRLSGSAWRAARLVVDTGIHQMRWTRDQAIQFMKDNTGASEHNIISEVDRYIAWPGQALAYKIGQLKISEIRARTEQLSRGEFDVRRFHDKLLSDGALPLDILENEMGRWLQAQAKDSMALL